MSAPSLKSLRKRASRNGYRLVKLPEKSPWFHQRHGPFFLADKSTNVVVPGLDRMELEEIAEFMAARAAA